MIYAIKKQNAWCWKVYNKRTGRVSMKCTTKAEALRVRNLQKKIAKEKGVEKYI
jgi:IS1 family transposase